MGVLYSTASFLCCTSPKWIFNLLMRYFWYYIVTYVLLLNLVFFLDYLGKVQGPKFDLKAFSLHACSKQTQIC